MNINMDDSYNTVVYSSYMIYLTSRIINACCRGVNYLYSNIKYVAVISCFRKIKTVAFKMVIFLCII